jgi:tape measure domain-containing protein
MAGTVDIATLAIRIEIAEKEAIASINRIKKAAEKPVSGGGGKAAAVAEATTTAKAVTRAVFVQDKEAIRAKEQAKQDSSRRIAAAETDQLSKSTRAAQRLYTNLFRQQDADHATYVQRKNAREIAQAQSSAAFQKRMDELFRRPAVLTEAQRASTAGMYAGMFDAIARQENATQRKAAAESIRTEQRTQRERTRIARAAALERARAEQAAATAAQRASRGGGLGIGRGLGMIGLTSTVIGVASTRGLFNAAETLQMLQQRLLQVTDSASDAKVMFDQLYGSSQRLRVPIGDVTELFVKLRQANQGLQFSAAQTLQVTEAFGAALRISGASGQTAASALLQFGQAMAKGKLDGDEFRTVAENASEVLRVLEKEFGVNRGTILKWREEGKLTSQMIATSLIRNMDDLVERANRLAPTMRQAMTQFSNAIVKMISDSETLSGAINGIAKSISDLALTIDNNNEQLQNFIKWLGVIGTTGFVIKNLDKWIIGLLGSLGKFAAKIKDVAPGIVAALTKIIELGSKIGPGKLALGGVVAGGFALGTILDEQQAAKIADRERKLRQEAIKSFSAYQKIVDRTKKAQTDMFLKASSLAAMRKQGTEEEIAQAERRLDAAIRAYTIEKDALDEVNNARQKLQKGALPIVTTADSPEKAKDTLDQYIGALLTLRDANIDVVRTTEELNRILDRQTKIVNDGNRSFEDRAQAISRQDTILRGMAEQLPDLSKLMVQIGLDMDKALGQTAAAKNTALIDFFIENADDYINAANSMSQANQDLVLSALAQATAELARAEATAGSALEEQKLLLALRNRVKVLGEIAAAVRRTEAAAADQGQPTEPKDRLGDRLDRQLQDMLRLAPGQLITDYFEALGTKVEEGGQSLADKMRQALGDAFGRIGPNLIQQGIEKIAGIEGIKTAFANIIKAVAGPTTVLGKFLLKIKGALEQNPLLAGVALIAIGGAMAAYAKSLGGNVSNAMAGRGGDFSNSLGIGGTAGTIPYVFQGRPYQNPMQGMGSTPDARGNVTVNATIIGPNDPQAQRQIADLVNNASRRGLMTGSAMRTR